MVSMTIIQMGRVIKVLLLVTWHLDQSGLVISDS